jgi:hypothetical protein
VAAAPGVPPERTALAWQRTGTAGLAVAGSTVVAAVHTGAPVVIVVAALSAVLTALAVGSVVARAAAVRDTPWPHLLTVAAIPVVLAPAGILLALLA